MLLNFQKQYRAFKAGQVVEISDAVAQLLLRRRIAVLADSTPKIQVASHKQPKKAK